VRRRHPNSGRPIHFRMSSVVRVVAWSDPCHRTTGRLGLSGRDRAIQGTMSACFPAAAAAQHVGVHAKKRLLPPPLSISLSVDTIYMQKQPSVCCQPSYSPHPQHPRSTPLQPAACSPATSSRERRRLAGSLVHLTFTAIAHANQPSGRPERPSIQVPQYPPLCISAPNSPPCPFFVHCPPNQQGLPLSPGEPRIRRSLLIESASFFPPPSPLETRFVFRLL